jgi:hypothetical protein
VKTRSKFILFLFVLSVISVLFVPAWADEWNKMVVPLKLGTTTAGTAASSGVYRVPQSAKIDSIYLTDQSGIASDATDYDTVVVYKSGGSIATWTSNGVISTATTLVAITPKAMTVGTGLGNLDAGDVLQARLTKAGSGKASTGMGLTITYFNTTSR